VHDSGQAVLITHPEDPAVLGAAADGVPLLALMTASSVLSVPLSDGENRYGVLTLARRAPEGRFELADLGLVEELGEQLALAIRVDRMFRRRNEIADALQASLLPRRLPEIPGVQIAADYFAATEGTEVGGDFYDVYRTPDGWGLAVGDVCGKGEEAAAVTAAARHAIRVIAHQEPDPVKVLAAVNGIMLAEDLDGGFVTAAVAHFHWDGGTLRVRLASAGQPGPVLIRPDGRTTLTRGGGLPLGLFPDASPGAEELIMTKGDLLFCYSDGITEARSPDREPFGDLLAGELTRLARAEPGDVVAAVHRLVLDFSGANLADDMTMLALKAGDPPDGQMARIFAANRGSFAVR
jgi:serine phosphatase RsbU (regulator of sigma subunit)